jgi:hypothetical protein
MLLFRNVARVLNTLGNSGLKYTVPDILNVSTVCCFATQFSFQQKSVYVSKLRGLIHAWRVWKKSEMLVLVLYLLGT